MSIRHAQGIKPAMLVQCREQIGYSLDDVRKKVPSIAQLEAGKKPPTFTQLDTLADMYDVPRWVFLKDELPKRYALNDMPAFRTFHGRGESLSPKTNKIILEALSARDFMLELQQELDRPVPSFHPPKIKEDQQANRQAVLQWLGVNDPQAWMDKIKKNNEVHSLRDRIEDKGVFVFFTSRFPSKFYAKDENFRGMAIYNETLPIIIVNSSDAFKAQAFTLLHELGHLLRETTQLTKDKTIEEENWCNNFASEFLMPKREFLSQVATIFAAEKDYRALRQLASRFGVSVPACLMRLKKLNAINQTVYKRLWRDYTSHLQKKGEGGGSHMPPRERLHEYGKTYLGTLFDCYHQDILSSSHMMRILNLKKYEYLDRIEENL